MAIDVLDRTETPTRPPARRATHGDGRHRAPRWLVRHRTALAWFTPVFVLAGVVQGIDMGGIPQRFDDEGTYVAQAFAVLHYGELTHYTYIYDHPPLGWLQLAGWFELTGALSRYSSAVLAGREFMLVMTLVSAVLLWLLARRLQFSRPAAAAVVAVFALSPLAVQFHRSVYLDNIATPWLLAAFLLALTPRRQLLGYAASGAAFAVAVLTKETLLLFLPFLAWQVWQGAHPSIRRYSLSVAATVSALVAGSYLLLAVLKDELLPAPHRSSLLHGVFFQLVSRTASGSLLTDPHSFARFTFDQWWALDPVFLVAAPLAALVCLRVRRLRPLAAALLVLAVFMLRPGYLPFPYVVALLPLGALVIVGAVETSLRAAWFQRSRVRRRGGTTITVVAALAVVVVAAPLWNGKLNVLLHADQDRPMADATAWVEQNVSKNDRLVVDDAMWVDLVRAGFNRQRVVWYYKVDTDPAVAAEAPDGWRDYDYVVVASSLRTAPGNFPIIAKAIANSTPVATFGTGGERVQVRRVDSAGAAAARAREAAQTATTAGKAAKQAARKSLGAQVVSNSSLDLGPGVANLIADGRLDGRAMAVLSTVPVFVGPLTVADLPVVPGENGADQPRRQVLLSEVDGHPLPGDAAATQQLTGYLTGQHGSFIPASVQPSNAGLLVTWPLPSSGDGPVWETG